MEIPLTPQAQAAWEGIYRQLDGDDSDDGGLLEDLCARLPAYLRRLALIYCLADGARAITPEHLQAALALVEYSRSTLDYVYSLVSWTDASSAQELIQQRAARFIRAVCGRPGAEPQAGYAPDLSAQSYCARVEPDSRVPAAGRPAASAAATDRLKCGSAPLRALYQCLRPTTLRPRQCRVVGS